jgi:hypothetical protein
MTKDKERKDKERIATQGATCEQPRAVAPVTFKGGRVEACEWQRAAEIAPPAKKKRGYLIVVLAGDQHHSSAAREDGEC